MQSLISVDGRQEWITIDTTLKVYETNLDYKKRKYQTSKYGFSTFELESESELRELRRYLDFHNYKEFEREEETNDTDS